MQTINGLVGFLEDLAESHVVSAIASSGNGGHVSFLLDRLDLNRYFPVVVTGDDVEHGKPDPAIFLMAA